MSSGLTMHQPMRVICVKMVKIKREITLKWEIIQIRKKIQFTYFFIRNPYLKFQNISIHGSKLMLCTIKQQMAKKLQRAITPTKFH